MAQQAPSKREVIAFEGKRVRYQSQLRFDDVLGKLRSRMGKITMAEVVDPAGSREEFEKKVKAHEGESGFMIFLEMNH